jgi:hypothetical protein
MDGWVYGLDGRMNVYLATFTIKCEPVARKYF